MTVAELLARIIAAYPGATDAAMATFKHREGPHLQTAFETVLASFRATARQPFPIPADIEHHMPSLTKPAGKGEKPIRDLLERRQARAKVMLDDWKLGQGAKIKAARPEPIYTACLFKAQDQAQLKALDDRVTGIILTKDELKACCQSALSIERRNRHGRPERYSTAQWWAQITDLATEWQVEVTPEWWSKTAVKALAA